ncbi:MAG: YesL family protein [Oscillospiraceae bacterium]
MGLFGNYNDSGAGVSKAAPRKKTFFRFFDAFVNKFWVLLEINFIYVLFCLPVVTFGPATAAMTTMMRNIYLEKPQFIFHDFWQAFKKNFQKSFAIGIVDVIAIGLAVFSYFFYVKNLLYNDDYWLFFALTMAAEVIFLMMNFFIYPQIVALDLNMPSILKNSLILAFVNLKGNIIALVFFLIYAVLLLYFHVFVLVFAPIVPFGWLGLIAIFCCYPAIQKFIINPFYEANGQKNPELPDYDNEDVVFEDMGGKEAPIKMKKEKSGKVIK